MRFQERLASLLEVFHCAREVVKKFDVVLSADDQGQIVACPLVKRNRVMMEAFHPTDEGQVMGVGDEEQVMIFPTPNL